MKTSTNLDVRNRIKCIKGHTQGLLRMIETDAEIMDILHQIDAIQGSWKRVRSLLIEEHLVAQLPQALAERDLRDFSPILDRFVRLLANDG